MIHSELAVARRWIRAQARFLCGGKLGRSKLDPVYIETTQGRDHKEAWHRYSSCGDLLHCLAVDLGVPIEASWINREAPEIGKVHLFGLPSNGHRDNLSMLWAYGGPMHATPVGYLPEPGDFLMLERPNGSGAHVLIAGEMGPKGLETFNYGAGGMQRKAEPGSDCSWSRLSTIGNALWLGTKVVTRCLEVPRLLALVPAGRLPDASGELLEALEASVQ